MKIDQRRLKNIAKARSLANRIFTQSRATKKERTKHLIEVITDIYDHYNATIDEMEFEHLNWIFDYYKSKYQYQTLYKRWLAVNGLLKYYGYVPNLIHHLDWAKYVEEEKNSAPETEGAIPR